MSGDFGCISHYNAQKWSKHGFRYKITVIPLYQNDGYSLANNYNFDTNFFTMVTLPESSFSKWASKQNLLSHALTLKV